MYRRLADAVGRRFRLDTRSLGVFRMGLGLLIVADVLLRFRNLNFFYTDNGVMPVSLAQELSHEYASLFFISGSPAVVSLLFGLHLLVGVALLVGYHTRITTVLAFLFVISLDMRMPLATSYADILFRHLLFWGMFLPLGERFSLDAIRRDRSPRATFTGLAGAFVLIQMVAMYVANGSHKIPWREDWLSGESLYGILHYDSVSWLLGPYLRDFPLLMQIGSVKWYALMLGAPMLLLLAGRARYLAAGVYAGGHLFMAVTVRIGAFPYAALCGLALFCGPRAWADARWIAARLGVVDRIDAGVEAATRRGVALDRRLPRLRMPETPAVERLREPARAVALAVVIVSGVFIVIPTLGTVGAIDEETTVPLEEEIQEIQSAAKLDQPPWRFYQGPIGSDEYYVFVGQRTDGEVVDVYNDRPMAWDRPHGAHNHKQLDTYRERFYMYAIDSRANPAYSDDSDVAYAEYLCDTYRLDGDSLTHLNLYVIEEDVDLDAADDFESYDREAVLIHAHGCGDHAPRDIELPPPSYTDYDAETLAAIEADDDRQYIEEVRSE
ncbi:MAG: HTTM domain-containing protein [Natronomonas sp.]